MNFDKWIHLVYRDENIPMRTPPSKHQAKILEILEKIDLAKSGIMVPLLEVEPISCIGESFTVSYCRYLQYMITVLKDEGKQE